jgi:hypothetical protein
MHESFSGLPLGYGRGKCKYVVLNRGIVTYGTYKSGDLKSKKKIRVV